MDDDDLDLGAGPAQKKRVYGLRLYLDSGARIDVLSAMTANEVASAASAEPNRWFDLGNVLVSARRVIAIDTIEASRWKEEGFYGGRLPESVHETLA